MSSPDSIQFYDAMYHLREKYDFDIDVEKVPLCCRPRLYNAAVRFTEEDIDTSRMGLCEEAGDMAYQLLKFFVVKGKVLTPDNQRVLFDRYREYIAPKGLQVPVQELYDAAYGFAEEKMVKQVIKYFPLEPLNAPPFPNPDRIAKDFLVTQFVNYISRDMRTDSSTQRFQTVEYIKTDRIPEEASELTDVILFQNRLPSSQKSFDELETKIATAKEIVGDIKLAIDRHSNTNLVFTHNVFDSLNTLLVDELGRAYNLERVLDFALFKTRIRNEMTFNGFNHRVVKGVSKVIEYFLEADLVMQRN